ncbi:MAG TPA: nitrilase-related carbon-nitrogen hydrolase [Acidimicrobiales bacterium]|nr:nitrilase-related carbon-nitrogen hydrolase [Acidimicrobiales bacterium]
MAVESPPSAGVALDRPLDLPAARGNGRRVAGGLALALLTPVLVALANPPFGLWPLVFVAFVPMVVAQHRVLPRRWSSLAIGIGIGGAFAVHLSPGLADGDVAIVYQLMPLYLAAIAAGIAWRSRTFQERTGHRWLAVSFPVAFTAIEFLRSSGTETFGGTWGFQAYALWQHPLLLQPISVFGITGLHLLIFVVNWTLAAAVLRTHAWRRNVAIVGAIAVAWVVAGALMIDSAPATLRVATVQNGLVNDARNADARLDRYVAQTRDAAARGARIVVWNEAGLRFDPQRDHTDELRTLAAETNAYLVLGYRIDEPGGRVRNATTLLAPDGRFLGIYGKDHPGTFAGDVNDFQGTFPVYDTEVGQIATIICYDLDYTDTARIMTRGGARFIATPSSDVPAIARTHYTHLVFRAIENRVSMAKADSRFDSAIIDPWGRVVARTVDPDGRTQATLVADIPLGSGTSPWVSFGNWLGWLTVFATGVLLVGSFSLRWRDRRRRRTAPSSATV